MTKITAAITAVAGYVPDYVLTNEILETFVPTTSEWIESRTGIKERRILKGEGLGTSDLREFYIYDQSIDFEVHYVSQIYLDLINH